MKIIAKTRIGSEYLYSASSARKVSARSAETILKVVNEMRWKSGSFDKALAAYRHMLKDYPETGAPLTGKYAKLRDDLREALRAGRAAFEANPEDGGACNFDSAAVALPRWNEAKVKQAAAEAGTGCFMWACWGGRRYVFNPKVPAQGNARSRAAEAMTRALVMLGYDAMDYCQLD